MSWVGRHKVLSVFIAVAVLGFFNAVSGSADDQPPADDAQSGVVDGDDSSSFDDGVPAEDDRDDRTSDAEADSPRRTKTYLVVHVVDGDTLDLGNGRRVRLAGIDAPEAGQCGYKRARNTLSRLVLGKRVRLGSSDEEQDQYGRLLKYVDVGRIDAGLRLIKEGLAVARYDSRDGYGYHPREPRYIAADQATPAFACAPKPVPLLAQPRENKPSKNCAPGYSPCIRPYPPDLDCADIGHPVQVRGSDPHGLDRDRDGIACEWS